MVLNFASEYSIRKVQGNQVRRKLNATHQLLVDADDMNLLGDKEDEMDIAYSTNVDEIDAYAILVGKPEVK
jgi:hypothetical protein